MVHRLFRLSINTRLHALLANSALKVILFNFALDVENRLKQQKVPLFRGWSSPLAIGRGPAHDFRRLRARMTFGVSELLAQVAFDLAGPGAIWGQLTRGSTESSEIRPYS